MIFDPWGYFSQCCNLKQEPLLFGLSLRQQLDSLSLTNHYFFYSISSQIWNSPSVCVLFFTIPSYDRASLLTPRSTQASQHLTPQYFVTRALFFSHLHISGLYHQALGLLCFSLFMKWIHAVKWWFDIPPPPTVPLRRTKVRGHWVGLRLSSWHLEVRAARKSGAWGSVSSMCRNTTFSSCWRTALSSCALPGPTGLWPSWGSTLRGWKRFVCTMIFL